MENLKIYLKGKVDKEGNDLGYFFLTIRGQRGKIYLPTGIKIKSSDWVSKGKNQVVMGNKELTDLLDNEKNRLQSIIGSLEFNGKLTLEAVKEEYHKGTNKQLSAFKAPPVIVFELGFLEAFDEFQAINKERFAPSYLRGYRSTKLLIERFDKNATWSSLTDEWLTKFHTFLLKEKFQPNYIFNIFKSVRGVVRLGEARGIKIPQFVKDFKLPQEEKNNVFLSKEDVSKLENVEILNKNEEKVRDMFLFRVYCGLRFQDLKMMNIEKLKDGKLPFFIQKSSKNHFIPVPEKAQVILKKYGQLGENYYEQKENVIIKKLCERAEINEPFEEMKREGKKVIVKIIPKHKKVSSHSARRTWARLMYESGIDILKISRLIGHSDTHTTLKYIGVSNEDFDTIKDIF